MAFCVTEHCGFNSTTSLPDLAILSENNDKYIALKQYYSIKLKKRKIRLNLFCHLILDLSLIECQTILNRIK